MTIMVSILSIKFPSFSSVFFGNGSKIIFDLLIIM